MLLRERDGRLVERARSGSAEAAEELVRRHMNRAWRAALVVAGSREAADDAVQEAFVSALRSLDTFDTAREFGPWIVRIAVNRALDGLRRRRPGVDLDEVVVEDTGATEAFARVLGDDALARRVAALPAGQRAVLVLRYWHDLRPVEVAEALQVAEGTVHSREKRALDTLRGQLEVAR